MWKLKLLKPLVLKTKSSKVAKAKRWWNWLILLNILRENGHVASIEISAAGKDTFFLFFFSFCSCIQSRLSDLLKMKEELTN